MNEDLISFYYEFRFDESLKIVFQGYFIQNV
jgi:hypothetical protein